MFTVARYVLLEARRSALPWLALGCVLGVTALAGFLSQVALTESRELQAAIAGALLRACAAFLIAAHVVASIAREASDRGTELALALPVTRTAYYFGKLLGFSVCGALLAAFFCVPLLPWSAPSALAQWAVSLAAESAMMAAASLFFAMTLRQVVPAIAAAAGLYLLGRSITTIQAIASGPLAQDSAASRAARWVLDWLALLLPRLDRVTRTDWLLYGAPPASELLPALASLAVYFSLLAFAGAFDFQRRNF